MHGKICSDMYFCYGGIIMLRFSVGLEIESLRFKSWSWIHLYNTVLWKLIKIDGQNPHEAYLKLVVCFTPNFISRFN